jgi:hypothetical protein
MLTKFTIPCKTGWRSFFMQQKQLLLLFHGIYNELKFFRVATNFKLMNQFRGGKSKSTYDYLIKYSLKITGTWSFAIVHFS